MAADQEQFERVVLGRLHQIETRHARLRWLLIILLLAVAWREFAYHPVVRADRFELVDTSGEVRGLWHMRAEGPVLLLRESDGWRAELSGTAKSGTLRIFGPHNTTEARISSGATATTLLLLSGPDQAGIARVDSDDGRVRLQLSPVEGPATVLPDPSRDDRD